MIMIKYLKINQISVLNDSQEVDMPLNKPNQTKPVGVPCGPVLVSLIFIYCWFSFMALCQTNLSLENDYLTTSRHNS